jgi:hypothetical protein
MKKKILISTILIILINFINFVFSQATPPGTAISPLSPEAWKYFYIQFRPFADVSCATGDTALEKITIFSSYFVCYSFNLFCRSFSL